VLVTSFALDIICGFILNDDLLIHNLHLFGYDAKVTKG